MPEWLFGGLITLGVALVGAGGLVIGYILNARTAKVTADATTTAASVTAAATAEAAERTDTQQLVDQLQEELREHRTANNARATAQDERMTKLDERNHALMQERDRYRNHAHELRAHIWDGNPPPPPEWPAGLPR